MPTSFVGRGRQIAEIGQLLSAHRLLSLLGPGGCGKTRLALSVAAEPAYQFVDGLCWVELARVSDPAFVPQAVAKALGVAEQPDLPLPRILLDKLGARSLLLILDNCEHLLAPCADLVQLLLGAPALKILTTSREPLGLEGEARYLVPPLSLPRPGGSGAELAQAESVRLFVERAQSVRPEFSLTFENAPLVADLCRHLDGLPLAIELASARVNVLSLQQLRQRLGHPSLMASAAHTDRRHQTLDAAIDWSYQLLSPAERLLLQRLSIFASGFTLNTAEATCSWGELEAPQVLHLLISLIEKSLVVAETLDAPEARYRLLETIRQYANGKLKASGQWHEAHDHYVEGFSRLVGEISPRLEGPEQLHWVGWLESEHENLREALEWACQQRRVQEGVRLLGNLTVLWDGRGHFREGFGWFGRLLSMERECSLLTVAQRVNALVGGSFMATLTGDTASAAHWAGEAVALSEAAGEPGWPHLGFALMGLASVAKVRGESRTALTLLERGIRHEREHGRNGDRVVFLGLFVSGLIETDIGDHPQAQHHLEGAMKIALRTNDPYSTALVLDAMGQLARVRGQRAQAVAHMDHALELFGQSGANRDLPNVERHLAYTCLRLGNPNRAARLFKQSLEAQLQRDHRPGILRGLLGFAALAASTGLHQASAGLQGFVQNQNKAAMVNLDSGDKADELDDEHYATLVRARMSDLELEAATEQGRAMRLEDAVAYALDLDFQTAQPRSHDLTRRERDIAGLIGAGLSNGEIAMRLTLSKRTVEKHMANILLKLALRNRAQIVRWAMQQGLSGEPK